jgi:hypothetical protein
MILLNYFLQGIPQVVMSSFNPDLFCALIEKYKITLAGTNPITAPNSLDALVEAKVS